MQGPVAPSNFFSASLLKHVSPMREILSPALEKEAQASEQQILLGRSLFTAPFESPTRPAGSPREQKKEIQDGSYASPAWLLLANQLQENEMDGMGLRLVKVGDYYVHHNIPGQAVALGRWNHVPSQQSAGGRWTLCLHH